jgi:deoxyinosine 3'endonuclease (endonuclease V)
MKNVSQIKNEIEEQLQLENDCLIDAIIEKIACADGGYHLNEKQSNAIVTYVTQLEYAVRCRNQIINDLRDEKKNNKQF